MKKTDKLSLQQLKQIAKAGFPKNLHKEINFPSLALFESNYVYRLYYKGIEFDGLYPTKSLLILEYRYPHISFDAVGTIFNQLAAIRKMEKMGLC
jgi:hypothetical protein